MYPLTRTGVLTNLEYDFVSIKLQWTTSICNLLIFLNVETFKYIFRTKVTAYTRPGAYKYEKNTNHLFFQTSRKKELQKKQIPKNRKNHNILVSIYFSTKAKTIVRLLSFLSPNLKTSTKSLLFTQLFLRIHICSEHSNLNRFVRTFYPTRPHQYDNTNETKKTRPAIAIQ